MKSFVRTLTHCYNRICSVIQNRFIAWTKPATSSLITSVASDLAKPKAELVAKNTLLRKQLIILNRKVKKPSFTPLDRFLLVLLVSKIQNWKQTLLILKPDTLLRWHRQGFRLFWKLKSKPNKNTQPKIAQETIDLI
jgi:hypothetical protein